MTLDSKVSCLYCFSYSVPHPAFMWLASFYFGPLATFGCTGLFPLLVSSAQEDSLSFLSSDGVHELDYVPLVDIIKI